MRKMYLVSATYVHVAAQPVALYKSLAAAIARVEEFSRQASAPDGAEVRLILGNDVCGPVYWADFETGQNGRYSEDSAATQRPIKALSELANK